MNLLLSVLEQGLIYAVLALGVYITFKILDFPDMTVDSSFPLGAAVTALMIQSGFSPLLTLLVKLLMDAYLSTRSGFLLRATGDNPTLVASLAKDSGKVKILGLSIANALVSLAGCVMCQYQRYFDISMGTGTLVLAVASVIVGTQLLRGLRFLGPTLAVILGSILYKGCVALALSLGLSPFDLKLVTAALLLIIIVAGGHRRKVKRRA